MIENGLYANGVRILRPSEFKKLYDAIPKEDNKIKLEALLYTGARYSEMKALYDNQKWFNGLGIAMPNTKYLAKKKYKTRNIRLNPQGQKAINQYLYVCKKGLPHYTNWWRGMQRWCKRANLDTDGIGIKTTRKSWESWLITIYEDRSLRVFLSQGHTETTALDSYLNLAFTEQDKEDMKTYVSGWI